MAVGLVMIYFFVEGLSVNFNQVFQNIQSVPEYTPAESPEAAKLDTLESGPENNLEGNSLSTTEKTDLVDKIDISYSQVETLAFHAPTQPKGQNEISSLEDSASLSAAPLRLVIPNINLDAPILSATPELVNIGGVNFQQWLSPDEYAVGWHDSSAKLGEAGNTVLNGHHNIYGEVFRRLIDLNQNDVIMVYSEKHLFTYQVTNKMILPEKYESLDVRVNNAQWILPSEDERLTLITCWPYESNTHRLIIVARLLSVEELPDSAQGFFSSDLYEDESN
jgi:LPXTG-site transpeptidase (sortase) family protein